MNRTKRKPSPFPKDLDAQAGDNAFRLDSDCFHFWLQGAPETLDFEPVVCAADGHPSDVEAQVCIPLRSFLQAGIQADLDGFRTFDGSVPVDEGGEKKTQTNGRRCCARRPMDWKRGGARGAADEPQATSRPDIRTGQSVVRIIRIARPDIRTGRPGA
jgi:hypothetical protein